MIFFGVFLTLYYDYMCSERDLTQEKGHFHPTSRIPNFLSLFAAALSHNGHSRGVKGMKSAFLIPPIKETNFNGKKGQNFHICLRSGPRELTPPPLKSVGL